MRHSEVALDNIVDQALTRKSGAQIYDELRRLLSVINGRNIQTILEIGSEEGGSLSVWLKMSPIVKIVNVDFNTYPHAKGKRTQLEQEWQSWCSPTQSISTIWGDSHSPDVKKDVLLRLGGTTVDMLYIDGDHSEKGVEQDYVMYKELVNSPGLIVVHDIHPYPGREEDGPKGPGVGVYKFWERLKGPAIDMFKDRSYHKGARPNWVEVCHDCKNQSSFGYGIIYI